VALTECDSKERHLLLVAHRLVVGSESWSTIVKDLDIALQGNITSLDPAASVRDWCHAQKGLSPIAHMHSPVANGHNDAAVTTTPVLELQMEIDPQLTEILVGKANLAFRTQPVDIIHGAMRHSYMRAPTAPEAVLYLEILDAGCRTALHPLQ
jgi:hypothetical protein